MVLVAPVGSTLEVCIGMFLDLALVDYFGTWEGSLVGVSLVSLGDFMIGIGEGYLVWLSLGLPLGIPI